MRPRRAVLLTPHSQTTACLQNIANSCSCHRSAKSAANPFPCHTSKSRFRKSFVCHTCETPHPARGFPANRQTYRRSCGVCLGLQTANCKLPTSSLFLYTHTSPGEGTGSWTRSWGRCGAVMIRMTAVRMMTAAATVRSEMTSSATSQPRNSATTGLTSA